MRRCARRDGVAALGVPPPTPRLARYGPLALLLALPLALVPTLRAQGAPVPQHPSPMIERSRLHERLTPRALDGFTRSLPGPTEAPVALWIADGLRRGGPFTLVIHFHGAAWLAHRAGADLGGRTVVAALTLGAGSGIYDRSFREPATFDSLVTRITRAVREVGGPEATVARLVLSGYSAGHGAVRAILRTPEQAARIDAVLLLDGMHTSYVPDGRVLADGGALDTGNLVALTDFARAAMRGTRRMLVTHSEIFPGTFASTTETADWMLTAVGCPRRPVLRWGPRGMQQLSTARCGGLEVLGYAGNAAPDHVDQLHAMPEFLRRVLRR